MSDKPISVGDLVVVVKANQCGCTATVGTVFRVVALLHEPTHCRSCKKQFPARSIAWNGREAGFQLSRLKRIPPLEELEGEKRDEEITA